MIKPETISELTGLIYNAALGHGGWEQMLHALSRATNASVGGLIIDGSGGAPDIVVTSGVDSASLDSYEYHYHKIDPVIPRVLGQPLGEVVTQEMMIDRSAMVRTEFYNDWLHPQGVEDLLAAKVTDVGGRGILAFAVPARLGSFDADAVRLVKLLVPHLQLAVRTHRHLHGLILQRDGALAALDLLARPILFVDRAARVVLANRAAERLLDEADGLSSDHGGGLRTATMEQTAQLRRLIAQAGGLVCDPAFGGSLLLDRPSGALPFVVTVMPPLAPEGQSVLPVREAGAIVLVATQSDDVSVSQQVLQSVFELTPAEARVTQVLLRGGGIKAAARTLGIAPSTVRTHLLRVFAKTGTARQAELVRRLGHLAVTPPLSD
jgi:DNA-binding CsgD family transcriptional regulator